MKSFVQILKLLKNYKPQIAGNVFFNILSTIFSIFSLTAVAPFLTILFAPDDIALPATVPEFSLDSTDVLGFMNYQFASFIHTYGKEQALIYFCIFIVIIFFLKNITSYFTLYFIAPVRVGVVRDLRESMHRKLLFLHLGYYSDERKGDLISRATSDVNEVENSIISSLEMVFRDPILIIAYLSTMIFMNWKLTIFVLVLLPLSGIFISKIGKSLKGASNQGQSKLGEVLSVFEESLSGMRIIQAFNAQDNTQKRFDTTNNAYHRLMVKLYRKQYLASPLTEILSSITLAVLIYYGGLLVFEASKEGFTGAFFVTFIVIFSQIIAPAKSFSQAYFKIQKGIASVERINKVLHAEELIREPKNPIHLKEFKDDLRFENIRFKYGNNEVISGINLNIKKGEKIALVGPSGGGKSTIANLVPRFYDVSAGRIAIDGVDIKEIPLKELRDLFGVVTQESILFNDTIANNIRLSRPEATDAQVYEAAKIANAYDFISAFELGFETNVGDSGNKLSGGQKQRISIARAVLKNPPFLILDEATSALDTESERLVQDAINKLMENRTSLVIAHRLSTIQHADKIVVLEGGKISEMGRHEELLQRGGTYKKLFDLQSFQ
ncbi:ABC transporter ATP-binding protein [Cryomorpha ignava]|uniref:ABC transporter ATP-binding protein n=1 Tax=Cryomorpha ignava TaxID=101383 RepID=A0A7K3WPC9_9FLAO|nr:ABC transporter ATP-binding protein [Cryomorpha ignava]NEN22891.1 ABC transporter ATP-binding protein [Cryomorpha ignava]